MCSKSTVFSVWLVKIVHDNKISTVDNKRRYKNFQKFLVGTIKIHIIYRTNLKFKDWLCMHSVFPFYKRHITT